MARSRLQIALAVIAVPVFGVAAFVAGLFIYVNATATPIHPDPKAIPSAAPSHAASAWTAATEQARSAARAEVTRQNLPGLSVAVGIGGDIVWAEGFGYADLDRRTTVTPETRFRIGGVSIALTSAAVGLLLEQQRLSLDSAIQRYVPEFPEKQWPVTVRELMAHLAGVRNDAGDEESLDRCERTADGLKRFADRPLLFEPGTRFRSSSYGWILVSAAIEAAAKEPFFTFMRTRIFEPLKMAATRPDAFGEAVPDRATFYYPRFAGDTRYGPEPVREGDYSCFAGAAAFLSTPSDLIRFGSALEGRLLQPATVELLQTPQRLTTGDETGYGLGWKVESVVLGGVPTRMAGHGTKADFIGGTASLMTFPERGIVVAVASNTSFADTRSIALSAAQAFEEHTNRPVR